MASAGSQIGCAWLSFKLFVMAIKQFNGYYSVAKMLTFAADCYIVPINMFASRPYTFIVLARIIVRTNSCSNQETEIREYRISKPCHSLCLYFF